MRIAVVGGAGTVGKHITAQLADSGHEVRVLSRHSREFPVDLTSGQGLASALAGCDVVVDSSHSQRQARQVLVEGTARLLAAEQQAGVGHHVAISIVGCDEVPYGYQKIKVEQERVVERGSVPWTIVRATQFYELVTQVLAAAAGYRLLPAPNMPLQPVAAADVGRAVAGAAVSDPRRGRISVAGPEVATARQLPRTWLSVTGRSAALIPVPLPGRTGRKLRDGALIPRQPDVTGTLTFADWLAAQDASG